MKAMIATDFDITWGQLELFDLFWLSIMILASVVPFIMASRDKTSIALAMVLSLLLVHFVNFSLALFEGDFFSFKPNHLLSVIPILLTESSSQGNPEHLHRLITSAWLHADFIHVLGNVLELLGYWGLSHRSKDRVAYLSGGLRRRLSILCGLAPAVLSEKPRVVLMDEPSEGLDKSSKNTLIAWIRALSLRNHAILIATHDNEISACANREIRIEGGSLTETASSASGSPCQLPDTCASKGQRTIESLISWSFKTELRNPVETIGRITPSIVAILLSYALVSGYSLDSRLHASLIFAPGFIAAITSPALISRLSESDCGRWWNAIVGPMSRPVLSITASSIILPIPITYLSWFILSGTVEQETHSEVLTWLWLPSLVIMDLAIAATALHLLVADLSRSGASPAPLLLIVLVWPFLQIIDVLAFIIDNGMSLDFGLGDPIPSCIMASLISAMIWLAAVMIPDA
mgnify:CR=1 FL=1